MPPAFAGGLYEVVWGNGPVQVVLIHGWSASTVCWRPLRAHLPERYLTVHAVDLPGFGRSPLPAGAVRFGVEEYAARLEPFLERTGPALLAGHSFGAGVSLALALQRPELVRGLVLIGANPGGAAPSLKPAVRRKAEQMGRLLRGAREDRQLRRLLERICLNPFVRPPEGELREAFVRDAVGAHPAALRAVPQEWNRVNFEPFLPRVQQRTFLVRGDHDVLAGTEPLLAIPGSVLLTVRESDHFVMMERPRALLAILLDLARGLYLPNDRHTA